MSELAVRGENGPRTFWRSDSAPAVWSEARLARDVHWRRVATGVDLAELTLAGTGEAWRTRLVVVRLDPSQVSLSLDTALTRKGEPAWKIARAPRAAVFAVNAGQFRSLPWGQVILDGRQILPPEHGPLAMTLAIDSVGGVHWTFDGQPPASHVAWAFQSYPVILREHAVPSALQGTNRGLDVAHRDARLALGRLESGALIVALTRFEGLGAAFGSVPFGLTVPEMAAVMGSLGATDAVLLDGGISAQLVAGDGKNRVTYRGWRDVPLALIARPVRRAGQAGLRNR
ncbi:MAG TPA: phosphodiester glycosidase family protein [Gemmatimonadaceae bacterium]|nr:phosphodiester glycosidase family protein [Gemmatimonadaceae bacterium]